MSNDRDTEDSLDRLRAVVRANPRSTTFVALANALCESGRVDEAEEVCRQGLSQHPRLVTGQVALGRALIARGRVREAQEVLIEAAKSSPEHGDTFRWLGDLVLRRGNHSRARAILEYAEELMPSDARVTELLLQAGGKPLVRAPRPKTDFEHTRVGNARALAERMHEDPPRPGDMNGSGAALSSQEGAVIETNDDPTVVRRNGAVEAWFSANADTTVELTNGADHAAAPPPPPTIGHDVTLAAPNVVLEDRSKERSKDRPLPVPVGAEKPPEPQPPGLEKRAFLQTPREAWQRLPPRKRIGLGVIGASVILAIGVVSVSFRDHAPPSDVAVQLLDLKGAIANGSMERLQQARASGRALLQARPIDANQVARLAFVNALLAANFGLSTAADANEAAIAALSVKPARPIRTALVEASRALVALSAGNLAEATQSASRATLAAPSSAEANLVAGRVRMQAGDLLGAIPLLEKAVASEPRLNDAVLARATAFIDSGDPSAAVGALEQQLTAGPPELRARLALSEANRAAGTSFDLATLREQCRSEGRESAALRAHCVLDAAIAARLTGDRVGALRGARAALVGNHRNLRVMTQAALLLAVLGEIDAAVDALKRIRAETEPGYVPRAWAELAVVRGRSETPVAGMVIGKPNGPDARLLLARLAFAEGGPAHLAETLDQFGTDARAADIDLKTFAALVNEGKLSDETRAALESRADKGDPMAAYVLGRNALAAGQPKVGAQRLHRALQGQGDACEAGRLLAKLDRSVRPSAVASEARIVRLLRGHNVGCLLSP